MSNLSFTCPYCNKPTTITDPNFFISWNKISIEKSDLGDVGLIINAMTCPNPECKKLYLKVTLHKETYQNYRSAAGQVIQKWQLLPESEAKVLPDYIPQAIQQDYYEACRIRDLSPKASATLSRRCLQGMIRDFWGIKKSTLKLEIDELKDKVATQTWEAIHSVREVGNIGAHMEKDINIIIDVEPNEAQLLIGLIETLVDDWYVTKYEREERLKNIKQMATVKKQQKSTNGKNN